MLPKIGSKIKELISKFYWVLIIPFFIWGLFFHLKEEQDFDYNQAYAYGVVTRFNSIHKQHSKRNYHYYFQINGNNYTGTSVGYHSQNIEIGNWYKIKYSAIDPENSRMIFDQRYYPKYEKDSLGKVVDTTFSIEESLNKDSLDLRIKRIKSVIDGGLKG
ncbi:hypothetical protein [Nonlabens marinus]|uniref:DUF3592 domain-containing protein n=1 Tax=Nonlabens marinus S1-08 TaxID=1454201 RepID=W8VWZ8_9FLAO|nr:hypothetical protein [Nonlabens marinus]BAO56778.1 hypothetical protein NMS_2769 [Nonlabens marinus S1-08]